MTLTLKKKVIKIYMEELTIGILAGTIGIVALAIKDKIKEKR
ncbi:hypothetical protein [Staphylococcus phage vB_SsapH-Golestan-100]|nr:hypothetical protein [Staphylococcus phage vB_SsapH-Golestan-100]